MSIVFNNFFYITYFLLDFLQGLIEKEIKNYIVYKKTTSLPNHESHLFYSQVGKREDFRGITMKPFSVAIVRYEKPLDSVRKVVELSQGLESLTPQTKVLLKPNVVFWTKVVPFPKWGVITTSRVVEDMVILLKEKGVDDITIGEGMVTWNPKDTETPAHAFESLGYQTLSKRYGVKVINFFERPFKKIDLEQGLSLHFNTDILECDLVIDLPVLKTHNQAKVSLGIKNLKGALNINSRKKCHSADPEKDLNYLIAKLPEPLPPIFSLLDGIYTNERGPSFDGKIRRSNILIASADVLSADLVGAKALGFDPEEVPHLVQAARNQGRPLDLSDIAIAGERLEEVASPHEFDFFYVENEQGTMPVALAKEGIKGLTYHKYDHSMCTYCSGINGLMLTAIRNAWKGAPWDEIEVLTGKKMKASPGKNKTILIGQCMVEANKNSPHIRELIAVKGCPPKLEDLLAALHQAGIEASSVIFDNFAQLPGFFMAKYQGRPEFDETFFKILG